MISALGSALDTALDRSVIGGYTRFGYSLRHLAWSERELPSLHGRTIAITGATSGIGRAAAELAALRGARLLLLVRDEARGEEAAREVAARTHNDDVTTLLCDLASLASVRECAHALSREAPRLDVLINNAGVLAPRWSPSADGYELAFATNLLGPFQLVQSLTPSLEAAGGRVITVSSGGMYSQRLNVADLQSPPGDYDGVTAYARTKRAQVVLSELLAERLAPRGITAHAMHPGWVDTAGVQTSLPRFHRLLGPALRSPEQGADTIVWLAGAPIHTIGTGGFWHDRRSRPTHLLPRTRETTAQREQLWKLLEGLIQPSPRGNDPRNRRTGRT